jgi:transposase-like protein
MAHTVKKQQTKALCRFCGKESEIWIIEYHSAGMKSKVYLCGSCGKPINIKNKIHFSKSPVKYNPNAAFI